jgi:hypothetical protein
MEKAPMGNVHYYSHNPDMNLGLNERLHVAPQVVQSRCYEAATAYWRRIKTDPDANTMGVLYWQLNDIWQVCAPCCFLSEWHLYDDYAGLSLGLIACPAEPSALIHITPPSCQAI